jgi:hypothetical protein
MRDALASLQLAHPSNHVRNNTGWVGVVAKNKTGEVSSCIASFREWATALQGGGGGGTHEPMSYER